MAKNLSGRRKQLQKAKMIDEPKWMRLVGEVLSVIRKVAAEDPWLYHP